MDSTSSTFLFFLLVAAAVELETVSSKRLALHKVKHLFPSTERAKEQVQLDATFAAGGQAHPAKNPAGEAKSSLAEEQQAAAAEEQQADTAAQPQPSDGRRSRSAAAAAAHVHDLVLQVGPVALQAPAEEQAQPAEESASGSWKLQSEEADAEEAHAEEEQPQVDEEYIQGYFHGYVHGRTDEYADLVAQTQLDETAAAQGDQQHAADSEAAEEVVAKVSDANAEKTHLDEARAALVAAQAPINNAQVAMAMEAFEADGRQQELSKAVEAMKKARMAAANSKRERARAASVAAQAPIDDAPVAMAEEQPQLDEGYVQGYLHGYIHGRTDEYADAVAQTQLDDEYADEGLDDQPQPRAEEAVAKVSDANSEKAHLDEARAALAAAQAPINNAQLAMAMEAFEADGRHEELIKAVDAMKKARMAANSKREKARAASFVAQEVIDDAQVAMAEEASDADGRRQEVTTAMGATKRKLEWMQTWHPPKQ